MNIELLGLTPKQMALCDIMWAIETREGVESFISTLPARDQLECRTLIELMQLAFVDEIESIDEAAAMLQKFMS
jgi:RNase P/RNase MRP subunit p30